MRVVSFLPSATEILYALRLGRSVRGVSHECDFPPGVRKKPVVMQANFTFPASDREIDRRVREALRTGGGLYRIDQSLLEALHPDLVVTQRLCDVCAVSGDAVQKAVRGMSPKPAVLSLHPHSLEGVFRDILEVGERTGKNGRAKQVVAALRRRVARVRRKTEHLPRPRVFSVEWCDPVMTAGHWIPEMVRIAGGEEGLSESGTPSVRIAWERVRRYRPEVLFLMPCGFSVRETARRARTLARLPGWEDVPAVRTHRVFCLNGSAYYNRPGPRLVDGLEMMAKCMHPDVFRTFRFKKDAVRCL